MYWVNKQEITKRSRNRWDIYVYNQESTENNHLVITRVRLIHLTTLDFGTWLRRKATILNPLTSNLFYIFRWARQYSKPTSVLVMSGWCENAKIPTHVQICKLYLQDLDTSLKHVETTSYSLDRLECPNLPFPMHQHKSHLTKYNGSNSGLKKHWFKSCIPWYAQIWYIPKW